MDELNRAISIRMLDVIETMWLFRAFSTDTMVVDASLQLTIM